MGRVSASRLPVVWVCRYVLDGVRRMRERPILDLVTGLRQLGADVRTVLGTSGPPVEIKAKGGLPGGKVSTPPHLVAHNS
jgi:5-enolpyruvylshikimate-3-phosphate synthase